MQPFLTDHETDLFQNVSSLKSSEEFWFWVSIISLIILALSEIIDRRLSDHKEQLLENKPSDIPDEEFRAKIKRLDRYESSFFWLSIISLFALGISEVISHRFAVNREEVITALEAENDIQYDARITDLRATESQSVEKMTALKDNLINSEKEILQLKIALKKAEAELISAHQQAGLSKDSHPREKTKPQKLH